MERLILTTRKYLKENQKMLLMVVGGYLGSCAAFGLWCGFMNIAPRIEFLFFYLIVAGLVCSVIASKMWFDLTSKEGRIRLLMTPSTPADKFWPRLIAVLPGTAVLAAAGYIVFGYADILAMGITYGEWVRMSWPELPAGQDSELLIWSMVSGWLINQGLFIFGSIFWPRKSFIKSVGIMIGLQFILSFAAMFVVKHLILFNIDNPEAFLWTVCSLTAAIGLLLIWFSYWKLKRITVI